MKIQIPQALILILAACCSSIAHAQDNQLATFHGPLVTEDVDSTTLNGKVMCGYQGWFNCAGDGAQVGWHHWAKDGQKPFAPGNVSVDLWPDVSELGRNERIKTGFKLADGRPAEVFSSFNRNTVKRHFQWMKDYGIDGAFIQRFANELNNEALFRHRNTVLANAREGAKRAGRTYAVMYDLSGLGAGEVSRVSQDWSVLRKTLRITPKSDYLYHDGKPVVAVWGIGFGDDRKYSLTECRDLIKFLKSNGCTVMVGVPTFWREQTRDASDDPMLHEILKLADIVSPWTIGRYRTPDEASRYGKNILRSDLAWCKENDLDCLPVVFPGFSWHNLTGKKLNDIPREKGRFLWSQVVAAKQAGCEMIYVAMFDEVDEGTAIFKCSNDPPVGDGVSFLTYEGLPSDYYLRLTGMAGKLLRDEIPLTETLPEEMTFSGEDAKQKKNN